MLSFVGDVIGEIAGYWLSLISARLAATRSSFGVNNSSVVLETS